MHLPVCQHFNFSSLIVLRNILTYCFGGWPPHDELTGRNAGMTCLFPNHLLIRTVSPRRKLETYIFPRSRGKLAGESELEFTACVCLRFHWAELPSIYKVFFPLCLFPVTSTGARRAWRKSNLPWIPPRVQTVQIVFFWGQSSATCHFRRRGRLKYIIWGVIHHATRYWLVPTFPLESSSFSCLALSIGSCLPAELQEAWGGWMGHSAPMQL